MKISDLYHFSTFECSRMIIDTMHQQ